MFGAYPSILDACPCQKKTWSLDACQKTTYFEADQLIGRIYHSNKHEVFRKHEKWRSFENQVKYQQTSSFTQSDICSNNDSNRVLQIISEGNQLIFIDGGYRRRCSFQGSNKYEERCSNLHSMHLVSAEKTPQCVEISYGWHLHMYVRLKIYDLMGQQNKTSNKT